MTIIPAQPYATNSRAEYRVFDKLKTAFVNDDKYLAFHSLNLTKHRYKRFGEADFVILCEYGLFVFEVKGGGVCCENDIWQTVDRNRQMHKIQNPFKQAEGALHAINEEIKDTHLFDALKISVGYGVIFPDIEFSLKSSEWDFSTICDSQKFKNFEGFLQKFFEYWHTKKSNKDKLTVENIKAIGQYLRPNFEVIESLYNQLNKFEEASCQLTQEQYKYLDIAAANKRILCSGGAGTGKTFLAVELSKRLAKENKKVMVVCKSKWLRQYLRTKIVNEFVTVATIKSAKITMKRAGIRRYEVLIIDEGQDLFNFDDIACLNSLVKGELKQGEWYIFHDINNQSGLFDAVNKEAFELLKSYPHSNIPLTVNCRNTGPIIKKITSLLAVDIGGSELKNGPQVREYNDKLKNGERLNLVIAELLNESIPPSSITILSPLCYEESSVSWASENHQIIKLDEFSIQSFPVKNISFAEIKNFKGLENEVIVVIDLPKIITQTNEALYYVAMSRAKGLLCVIF
ncbi:hypothetical protein THERMOT_2182 [Bathymodiolus thermophilus thioautotrophic gill symbiont]|uniref:nuclease-related domain-containing DEAD/DEAH box helicase n=1 Tax=Bathymodiolus thermophilus thioautotrophic gill symbiont TaxID=2360 RepID=UPI00192B9FFE|nr:NERD domain-containing protein [Bathymodiolus thermophilus thioautotrophic gill symbiont]CAB5505610.1 hypothetical protein THERMOT_2182 [Bathymodiolus thermophilus thioautotrophic gill symbiont]